MRNFALVMLALFGMVVSLTAVPGCGDSGDKSNGPPPKVAAGPPAAAPGAPPAAPAAPGSPPAPRGAPVAALKESTIVEARKRTLTKEDFTESDNNRDPFRSFLQSFVTQVRQDKAHPIVLEKFTIEELKLAGIITGEIQPRAMFIDPVGQGVSVIRGDHMSKADALVTRIAPDRVYLRIEEGGGEHPVVTERQIELHAGELSGQ